MVGVGGRAESPGDVKCAQRPWAFRVTWLIQEVQEEEQERDEHSQAGQLTAGVWQREAMGALNRARLFLLGDASSVSVGRAELG